MLVRKGKNKNANISRITLIFIVIKQHKSYNTKYNKKANGKSNIKATMRNQK